MVRAKMYVNSVKRHANSDGSISQEEVSLNAVYGPEGSANSKWAKYTPSGNLTMNITNQEAYGKILPGQYFFVDLTPCDKDAF